MTAKKLRYLLNNVKYEGRILCTTGDELVNNLVKNHRSTVKLLRPRNRLFNLIVIFQDYAITNKEEEVLFVTKL